MWGLCRSWGDWCPTANFSGMTNEAITAMVPDNGAAAQERAGTREFYLASSIPPFAG